MSLIYKITNDLNGKVYIGKTNFTIKERFSQHCRDALKRSCEKRPLYSAIRKYGEKHFRIEEIERCNPSQASEREIYWIDFYNSYHKGYNATKGGDGKPIFDYNEIALELKRNLSATDIAKKFKCSPDTVRMVAKNFGLKIPNYSNNNIFKRKEKPICQYNKNQEYIQKFDTIADASKWLYKNHYCSSYNSGVRSHISECAKGKRKSAYGYVWKY